MALRDPVDDRVRAVLLTGAGRVFCAGQDLKEVAEADMSGAVRVTLREHYNPIILGMTSMPKPIVAAVNGIAAGAGASLAFAADFRLAAESATFGLPSHRADSSAESLKNAARLSASAPLPKLKTAKIANTMGSTFFVERAVLASAAASACASSAGYWPAVAVEDQGASEAAAVHAA